MQGFINKAFMLATLLLSGPAAWSQAAQVYEVQATALAEINAQVYELNSENRPEAALKIIAKAVSNFEKQSTTLPDTNHVQIYEVEFDDHISLKSKSKISSNDIYKFSALPEESKQQVLRGLEQKYSAAFFEAFLQMRRFHFHNAFALDLNLKQKASSKTADVFRLESELLGEIVLTLSNCFLLKNTNSGITYVFNFADVLGASLSRSALFTEFASINTRLIDLYITTISRSKNPTYVGLKNAPFQDPYRNQLFSAIQAAKIQLFKLVMDTAENKLYVN